MSTPTIGLFVGLLLAIAAAIDGFGGFLLAVVLGALGWLAAAQLTGAVDVAALVRGRGRG